MATTIEINQEVGSRDYEDFIDTRYPVLDESYPVASGQDLSQYQVCALNSSREVVAWDSGSAAPVNAARLIAMDDYDATGGAIQGRFYTMGVFNSSKVIYGDTGGDEDNALDSLQTFGVRLVKFGS